jgi:hypothetical protein
VSLSGGAHTTAKLWTSGATDFFHEKNRLAGGPRLKTRRGRVTRDDDDTEGRHA